MQGVEDFQGSRVLGQGSRMSMSRDSGGCKV